MLTKDNIKVGEFYKLEFEDRDALLLCTEYPSIPNTLYFGEDIPDAYYPKFKIIMLKMDYPSFNWVVGKEVHFAINSVLGDHTTPLNLKNNE